MVINLIVWIGSYQLLRCENLCVLIKGGLFCVCFPTSLITRIGPRHEKTCLRGFDPGKTQTGLLNYRD